MSGYKVVDGFPVTDVIASERYELQLRRLRSIEETFKVVARRKQRS